MLREFFGQKSTFLLIDHFHIRFMVVGDRLRKRNPKKHPKKRNNSHLFSDVINDVGVTQWRGVKSGRLVEIYPTYICFDSEFSPEFRLNIFQAQLGSSQVKLGANPSNRGPIGSLGRNIYGPSMSHQNTQNMRALKV